MEPRKVLAGDAPERWNALYRPPGTRQIVLGLEGMPRGLESSDRFWPVHMSVFFPFRPLGLFLAGVTAETQIRNLRCGNQSESNDEPMSGLYFATHESFAELKALADRGEIAPPANLVFEMDALEAGNRLTLEIRGPVSCGAVWGLTYEGNRVPCERIEVMRNHEGSEGYSGRVLRTTLRGSEVVFEASAPNEEGVYRLIESRHGARPVFG